MRFYIILLLIIRISVCLRTACDDGGDWIDQKTIRRYPFSHIYVHPHVDENASNTLEDNLDHYDKAKLWSLYACAAESKIYNCQWMGIEKDRDLRLQRRIWKPKNKDCLDFYASDFLDTIRGRNVLLVGDSIMAQLFSALVCEIYQDSESQLLQEWSYDKHCLTKENCKFRRSSLFTSQHSNIFYRWMAEDYSWSNLLNLIQNDTQLTENDVVIFNAGVHYHDPNNYREVLNSLKDGVHQQSHSKFPFLMFLESTPQHFYSPESPNGYYRTDTAKKGVCSPYPDLIEVAKLDWRNTIANEILFDSNFTILQVAETLYSQYDAHLGKANWIHDSTSDCTHFCPSSHVFRFILRKIYNVLVRIDASKIRSNKYLLSYYLPDHSIIGTRSLGKSVFVIINGTKHRINNVATFYKYGYSFENTKMLWDDQFMRIPWGEDLV